MQKNNKTILFICPYPVNHAPSQRFRFEQYFDILKENGFGIKTKSFIDLPTWKILYASGHSLEKIWGVAKGLIKRIFLLFQVPIFDFVFIHREATPIGPPWFEWIVIFVLRKKVIYDFDDAIWLPNTTKENKIVSILKWQWKVSAICKWSYKVSCGNEYLCDYARQFNRHVFLNPTTIDTENLHNRNLYPPKKNANRITIGWTGTHSTLKYIDSVLSVIETLENKFPNQLQFIVIADKKPDIALSSMSFVPWSKESEIQDLLHFDIGIMPLTDDAWAKGKCGFKALQFMALEIPAVVSPVGVNTSIIQNEINGFTANGPEDWIKYLETLIQDRDVRIQIGQAGRKKIIDSYSVESNSSTFLSLFE